MLLLTSVVLTACQPPCPLDYPDGKWVCEEPYMWFEVRKGEYPAKGEITTENGEIMSAEFEFFFGNMGICVEDFDMEINSAYSFVGWNVNMRRNGKKMVLTTAPTNDYESDQLYHGKYKKLTFKRQD